MDFGIVIGSAFVTTIAFVGLVYYFLTQID
jgi:hypothetical protein